MVHACRLYFFFYRNIVLAMTKKMGWCQARFTECLCVQWDVKFGCWDVLNCQKCCLTETQTRQPQSCVNKSIKARTIHRPQPFNDPNFCKYFEQFAYEVHELSRASCSGRFPLSKKSIKWMAKQFPQLLCEFQLLSNDVIVRWAYQTAGGKKAAKGARKMSEHSCAERDDLWRLQFQYWAFFRLIVSICLHGSFKWFVCFSCKSLDQKISVSSISNR